MPRITVNGPQAWRFTATAPPDCVMPLDGHGRDRDGRPQHSA